RGRTTQPRSRRPRGPSSSARRPRPRTWRLWLRRSSVVLPVGLLTQVALEVGGELVAARRIGGVGRLLELLDVAGDVRVVGYGRGDAKRVLARRPLELVRARRRPDHLAQPLEARQRRLRAGRRAAVVLAGGPQA